MTPQEAIRLLRTEQLGDSELLELAKQMGADALERQHLHFVTPKCETCGQHIVGVTMRALPIGEEKGPVFVTTEIDPACCPKCGTLFARVDIDYETQTAILKAAEYPPRRAHINRAKRKYKRRT